MGDGETKNSLPIHFQTVFKSSTQSIFSLIIVVAFQSHILCLRDWLPFQVSIDFSHENFIVSLFFFKILEDLTNIIYGITKYTASD